jgi:hypothetical protein
MSKLQRVPEKDVGQTVDDYIKYDGAIKVTATKEDTEFWEIVAEFNQQKEEK